jgi:integrase
LNATFTKKGIVFCTQIGSPLNPDNITNRDFHQAPEKTDAKRVKNKLPAIGKVRWHDLSRTFGSLKVEQGENVYYVMRQMGHSSIQVTIDIYGHLLKDRNPEAAAKTDVMIFGA